MMNYNHMFSIKITQIMITKNCIITECLIVIFDSKKNRNLMRSIYYSVKWIFESTLCLSV